MTGSLLGLVALKISDLGSNDIRWLLKVIFESKNLSGTDIETAVLVINKLKTILEDTENGT